MNQNNSASYDKEYYDSVYNRYLKDGNKNHIQLSEFWMYNVFTANGFTLNNKKVLDFGSGPGHLTISIQAECYDISSFIIDKLQQEGRKCYTHLSEIENERFDYVFSSHSLEHSVNPAIELDEIYRILKPDGVLFLIVPLEKMPDNPVLVPDIHQHFFTWNFQNITNLLNHCKYNVKSQDLIFGPTGLKFFKNNYSLIRKFGRIKKHWPSQFTIAQKR